MERFKIGHVQRDLHREQFTLLNRLRSIHDDAGFVDDFMGAYPGLAVFANLRQGVWYAPETAARCYFKSTDGHYGAWKFNLNRTNLHVVEGAACSNGVVIIDATRRGKRFPDSQTRTIPIWAAVINRCVQRLYHRPEWDINLYMPPSISLSERSQVESIIEEFVNDLCNSSADLRVLALLDRPLRPVWVDRQSGPYWTGPPDAHIPIVCLSCSRNEDDVMRHERRGWHYIQGAADDEENWAGPVTAAIFARDRDRFAAAADDDECREIARRAGLGRGPSRVVIADVAIAIVSDISDLDDMTPAIVISAETPRTSSNQIWLDVVDSKTDKSSLERSLPFIIIFYKSILNRSAGSIPTMNIVGHRPLAAAIITAIIVVFFDVDQGQVRVRSGPDFALGRVSKELVRRSLQLVQRWAPDIYPSRLLMQQLNRFFMSVRSR